MDVKKICSAFVLGATLLTVQGAAIQAFADIAHTPGTPQNAARLREDARIANASRIARGRRRGADVANYRRSHAAGTPENARRIAADRENYRVSHTAGTAQYRTRVSEDIKIGNASRARRAAWARAHHRR